MEYQKEYQIIANCLKSMREEYKVFPTKFLLRKIELATEKLKAFDKAITHSSKGSGNYNSNRLNA